MKVYLTVIIKSKAEHTSTLKNALQQMVIDSQKEKSCLQYDLFQATDNKNTFIFQEIWENQEGLNLHNNQYYIREFQTNYSSLAEEIIIYKTNKIN